MNRYFLIIACLQLWAEITPVNPLTTWAPLVVIFGITAVKELLDDLGRAREDRDANSRQYDVVRNGSVVKVSRRLVCSGLSSRQLGAVPNGTPHSPGPFPGGGEGNPRRGRAQAG